MHSCFTLLELSWMKRNILLTLEDGTYRLCWNVSKKLPLSLRNNPEEGSSHLLCNRSLQSRVSWVKCRVCLCGISVNKKHELTQLDQTVLVCPQPVALTKQAGVISAFHLNVDFLFVVHLISMFQTNWCSASLCYQVLIYRILPYIVFMLDFSSFN